MVKACSTTSIADLRAMRRFRFVPDSVNLPFMSWRRVAFICSFAFISLSVVLFLTRGLNYGIDFRGGILIEVKTPQVAQIASMRDSLGTLGLGEIALQEFGAPDDILISVEMQEGDEKAQLEAVSLVKARLEEDFGNGLDYRRTEFVGPKVGSELILLVGCGKNPGKLDEVLKESLRLAKIVTDVMTTGAACRTYNVLVAEDRRVAAALIALQ